MLVHILKANPSVRSVSFQQDQRKVNIFVEGGDALNINQLTLFFNQQMKNDYRDFDPKTVTLIKIHKPLKTLAGKHVLMRPHA